MPDNGGGFLVHQQMVFVLRVFLIPERGDTAGKTGLAGLSEGKRNGTFLEISLLVHLVEDVLERRNVVILPHGVDTVIHGDIADTVSWEKSPQ